MGGADLVGGYAMTTATTITALILVFAAVVSYIWARLLDEDESP
jgi:hypothetical protein